METTTTFQKGVIALNGINAYITWKSQVIKETFYDEEGHSYLFTHPNATIYIGMIFGKLEPVKWDL